MESFKQIKYALPGLLLFLICSCSNAPQTIVLQEIAPLPRAVVVQQSVVEFEQVYTTLRIVEVSEVNGVQRYFLVRIGSERAGIQEGVVGEISEDASFQRVIGAFRIVELQGNFFRCEITELTHRIGTNAHVRVPTGELRELSSR